MALEGSHYDNETLLGQNDAWCLLLDWSNRPQMAFGRYWFVVRRLNVAQNCLEWEVKPLRSFLQSDEATRPKNEKSQNEDDPLSLSEVANDLRRNIMDFVNPIEIAKEVRPLLTVANLVNACR